MQIVKRNGNRETVKLEKIAGRIRKMTYELNPKFVDYNSVAVRTVQGLYDGVTSREIDNLAAETAASMTTHHPDYAILASRIALTALHKETPATFSEAMEALDNFVNEETNEPCSILDPNFIASVRKNAAALNAMVVDDRDFKIKYFGFKTLERSYLKKINGKVVERPQYMYMRVAVGIWGDDLENVQKTYDLLSLGLFTHATPTLFNAGTKLGNYSSCFLVANKGDDIHSLFETLSDCSKMSKVAGGLGLHVHDVRAKGSFIRGTGGKSDGLIPMLRVYNEMTRWINQGGMRKGSMAVYLEPWHADVFDFVQAKNPTGDENMRARDLFLALWVPDLFMKRVKDNGDWSLFCPDECPGLADVYDDGVENKFTQLYESYEKAGKARRVVKARELMTHILHNQIESGVPYISYKDAANRKTNHKNLGTIKSSNLCVAPETLIISKFGQIPIKEVVDTEMEVWNGFEWSKVTPKKTGTAVRLRQYNFNNGKDLWCTDEHKFYLSCGSEIQASRLRVGDELAEFSYPETLKNSDTSSTSYVKLISVSPGYRIDDTYCLTEPKRHTCVFNGILTGNCNEVYLYTDPTETAVCTLATICVNRFLDRKTKKYDFIKLGQVAEQIVKNLDQIIDVSVYPTKETEKSNKTRRPLGIGIQGLADLFAISKISFDSTEAKALNLKLVEHIYYHCLKASNELAMRLGSYVGFEGSPASQGVLQFDMWGVTPSSNFDWDGLKQSIIKGGLRNSMLCTMPPTASTASVLDNNEAFEPFTSNLYKRNTLGGEFIMVNRHLVHELCELGLWNDNLRLKMIQGNGSVQHIEEIPEEVRARYKTVWELPVKLTIDMATDRGAFICQSQSMNLFISDVNVAKLNAAHFYGWEKGLKTGMYYLRTQKKLAAMKGLGVDMAAIRDKVPEVEKDGVACSLDNPAGCESCSS